MNIERREDLDDPGIVKQARFPLNRLFSYMTSRAWIVTIEQKMIELFLLRISGFS